MLTRQVFRQCLRSKHLCSSYRTNLMSSVTAGRSDSLATLVDHVFAKPANKHIDDVDENKSMHAKATVLAENLDRAGNKEQDKAEVQEWLTKSAKTVDDEGLLDLNTHLAQHTFLQGNDWTVADIVYYARLTPTVASWDSTTQNKYCHITRWVNHIQHLPQVTSLEGHKIIELEEKLDTSVTVAIRPPPPKESATKAASGKKEKPVEAAPSAPVAAAAAVAEIPAPQKKKEKKEKAPKAPAAVTETVLSPSLISLKVGHIQKAILHPDADTLYVSTVDLGEDEPRTVVSGLVKYIPLAEMQGRKVICVCNLKPASMRGIKSSAMVLAASPRMGEGEVKDVVELVSPPANSKPGDVLSFKGFEGQPESQLNPKKKIFEQIQVGFSTTDKCEVIYTDIKEGSNAMGALVNESGEVCTVQTLVNASIR